MADMSISGVVSGMDWDSIIDKIITKAAAPAQVQVSKRTSLQNKKTLFEEMKVMVQSMQSSMTSLKLPSTYKAKEIEIENMEGGSYKKILTATVNADAEVNVHDLKVKQIATAQTVRSRQINGSTIESWVGGKNSVFYINAGGQKVAIEVKATDTLQALKSRINNTLKTLGSPIAVTASVVDNKLILKSDSTGLGTKNVEATVKGGYSATGINSLKGLIANAETGGTIDIAVDDDNINKFKITSKGKEYTYGKDYVLANNNQEVRWKQYEDTDNEIKLGESITAKYVMGAGDVYEKTGKKSSSGNTDTIEGFDFDLIDKGTLSQRLKIKGNQTTTSTTTTTSSYIGSDQEVGTTTTTEKTKDENGNDVITKTTVTISEGQDEDGYIQYEIKTQIDTTRMTEFIYGKDFTYEDGKVTWIGKETETCEPESYTVSIERDDSVVYSVNGRKKSETIETTFTNEPDNYSVKIKTGAKGSYDVSIQKTNTYYDAIAIDFNQLSALYKEKAGTDLPTTTLSNNVTYLDPANQYRSDFNITVNGTTYEYGKDFVIRATGNSTDTSNLTITWGNNRSNLNPDRTISAVVLNYATARSIGGVAQPYPAQTANVTFSYAYDYEKTLPGTVNKNDNDKTLETIFGEEIDPQYYSTLTIRGYDYGTDFEVNDEGEIVWLEQTDSSTFNTDDDELDLDVSEFNAAYKKATGKDVQTLTLTGPDGMLRTYLDPSDRSFFNLTDEDGIKYEYGRDYVLRVNDDGKSYTLTWFAADDRTGDNITDANDANVVAAAYAEAKNISTLNFKKSPRADTEFTFGFSAEGTKEFSSNSISSSASDKDLSLEVLFGEDSGIEESEYNDIVIKDANGKTYEYSFDFTITDGKIEWLPPYDKVVTTDTILQDVIKSHEPEVEYTLNFDITFSKTSNITTPNDQTTISNRGFMNLDDLEAKYKELTGNTEIPVVKGNSYTYLDDPSLATIIDAEGFYSSSDYVYGRDYVLRRSINYPESKIVVLEVAGTDSIMREPLQDYIRNKAIKEGRMPPDEDYYKNFTWMTNNYYVAYQQKYSGTANTQSRINTILDTTVNPADYKNLSITDADGKIYNYVADENDLDEESFTIVNGRIKWYETIVTKEITVTNAERIPKTINAPDSNADYTLYYESFTGFDAEIESDGQNEQELKLLDYSKKTSNSYLSYDQILKDADSSLSDSSTQDDIDEALKDYFSLSDSSGTKYIYGEDYIVTGDSSEAKIEWFITPPEVGTNLTLKYGAKGGEEIEISQTRSDTDRITDSSFRMPTSDQFEDATVRISDGINDYYRDIDFTIDDSGVEPVFIWNTDPQGTPGYLPWFGEAKDYLIGSPLATVTASDGTVTTYSNYTYDENTGEVSFGTSLDPGTYNFAITKDGSTKVFKLTCTATTMSLSIPNDAPAITATKSDGTNITDYAVSSNSSGEPVFTKADGTVLDAGDYEVKVVKDGATRIFDITSDGTNATITQRSNWRSQENTSTGKYTIYVSNSTGATQQFSGIRPAGTYNFYFDNSAASPLFSDVKNGTVTVTQGYKTFYEGEDFEFEVDPDSYTYDKNGKLIVDDDGDPVGSAVIKWKAGGDEWFYPSPGSAYTINLTNSDGTSKSYTAYRNSTDTIDIRDYGLTTANGTLSVKTGTDESGNDIYTQLWEYDSNGNINYVGNDAARDAYSYTVTKNYDNTFAIHWFTPNRTAREGLPSYGDELEISYEYDANEFTLSDDGDGLLDDLGLDPENWYTRDEDGNKIDNAEFFTGAHNAIIELNGEEIQRDSNDIGESYDNEIAELKGVTLHLKGIGEVSLDIAHDAQKAVETIQTLVDGYNDLMQWINTRMTEKQVDKDTKATIDSDDFRMRWGLLHGNSLLRNTKSQMRSLISQNFNFGFTQRASAQEIYGTMALNGLRNDATLRLRSGSKFVDVPVLMTDRIQDIVDRINDSSNPAMRNIYYDDNGNLLSQPLLKAAVNDDRLVISSTSNDEITMSGSSAMNALKMNYTYKGLYQLGLATTSTDYGKSGELEFDTSKFMEALEDEPDEVQELMLIFANQMDSWLKSMTTTSASGETSGTLTRQIEDLDTQIASIDEYLEKYQDRLDRQEETLRKRYAAAEEQFYKLSQQANSIASILSMMNGNNNSGNSNYTASA